MITPKRKIIFVICFLIFSTVSLSAQTFKVEDYYQLADGNEWRYTAPPNWKDGDYISHMKAGEKMFIRKASRPAESDIYDQTIKHFDATKAAKILMSVKSEGLYYLGEEFSGGESVAKFDKPILWFPAKIKIGDKIQAETNFTRRFRDGKELRGIFQITQKIVSLEDVKVTAGDFKKTLRVESETFWDLGDGRRAKSQNIYHYAKGVGVVKASARFIIINAEGKETINRLVETDLKSYKIRK